MTSGNHLVKHQKSHTPLSAQSHHDIKKHSKLKIIWANYSCGRPYLKALLFHLLKILQKFTILFVCFSYVLVVLMLKINVSDNHRENFRANSLRSYTYLSEKTIRAYLKCSAWLKGQEHPFRQIWNARKIPETRRSAELFI